jgi:hypothetical protein
MSVGPLVVLDACVLANFSLCDTLLRLAEDPPLYEPRWSAEIMAETARTLESKLGWPAALTSYFQSELLSHFGDAWVTGHGPKVSGNRHGKTATTRRRPRPHATGAFKDFGQDGSGIRGPDFIHAVNTNNSDDRRLHDRLVTLVEKMLALSGQIAGGEATQWDLHEPEP